MMDAENVISVYDAVGERFARQRTGLTERPWLDRFFMLLPRHAGAEGLERRILDVGCGAGRPIARYLHDRGAKITGLDASTTMLALFEETLPQARKVRADMRQLALDETFDGIIAWDSFFHLPREDQPQVLARFAAHLVPNGVLLFTSGPQDGISMGEFEGHALYHASLSPEGYTQALRRAGCEVLGFVPEDPQTGGHSIWLARKLP